MMQISCLFCVRVCMKERNHGIMLTDMGGASPFHFLKGKVAEYVGL